MRSSSPAPAVVSLLAIFCYLIDLTSALSLKIRNTTPAPICYAVENSVGSVPTNTMCDPVMKGIVVPGRQNLTLTLPPNFNGAFTDFRNWTRGARHEINIVNGSLWYDVDYEMGISNSTFGPASGRNRTDGLPSLAGEKDCLAKANIAWNRTELKPHLINHYYYLEQGAHGHGNLTGLRMDKLAPLEVMWFLQLEANLTGYVWHGSVDNAAITVKDLASFRANPALKAKKLSWLNNAADKKSWMLKSEDMVITAY